MPREGPTVILWGWALLMSEAPLYADVCRMLVQCRGLRIFVFEITLCVQCFPSTDRASSANGWPKRVRAFSMGGTASMISEGAAYESS